MVKIKILGYPAEAAGFKEKELRIYQKVKIRDLVKFHKKVSEERIIVLVNHNPATLDTEVSDDDFILILPVVGGG
ncbi:MAG: MoaD/ThiS family protein [Candidatus Asgardarchaeia archaeon]